jgi:hypothetical protein
MSPAPVDDDPVPPGILLDLGEALRVLEALEDALASLENARLAPGLQDEIATVIRVRPAGRRQRRRGGGCGT